MRKRILITGATDEFASASGQYFDNDAGRFAEPHTDVAEAGVREGLIVAIEEVLKRVL